MTAVHDEQAGLAPPSPTVLVIVKAPRPGTVKSRIATSLGSDAATRIHRRLVERQMAALPRGWPVEVHFAPADAEPEMRAWLGPEASLFAQTEGDLGARLSRAVSTGFERGATGVLVIGGDCPELDEAALREAAAALKPGVVVIGPARDGGYYLMGLSASEERLFADIPWSTPAVFPLTRLRAKELGLAVHILSIRRDIDTLDDVTWFTDTTGIALDS